MLPRRPRILAGTKAFYKFLLSQDFIEEDPSVLLEGPKLDRKLPDTLSFIEIEKILSAIDLSTPEGTRNRAIIETLYSSGMRVSELTEMRLTHLYADIGFIRIIGKGNKERLVPIGKDALRFIKLYLEHIRSRLDIQPGNENYLFLNRLGTKLSRVMIFNIVKQAVAAAGLDKNVSPHTFRHSLLPRTWWRGEPTCGRYRICWGTFPSPPPKFTRIWTGTTSSKLSLTATPAPNILSPSYSYFFCV